MVGTRSVPPPYPTIPGVDSREARMMNKGHVAAFIITVSLALPASADQAAYITKVDAERAHNLLKNTGTLKYYCAPCRDAGVESIAVRDMRKADVNYKGYWEIRINGDGVDLAYLYFLENDRWRNVAIALSIPVQDVPEFIE
jgi:hypothetical protein